MWHELALRLGGTVGELKARMSSEEFTTWLAFFRVSPWSEGRMDLRFAMLACVTASAMTGKKFEVEDFMLRFEDTADMDVSDPEPGRSDGAAAPLQRGWERQLQMVEMLNAVYGGVDHRSGEDHRGTPPPYPPPAVQSTA